MIDERSEETASLYVFGLLDDEDARRFEEALRSDAELARLVSELEAAAASLAHTAAPKIPAPDLKNRILDQIRAGKVAVMPRRVNWLPWALAACLAVIAGGLAVDRSRLQRELSAARDQDELSQIKIATLASLVQDAPKGVAVVAWDSARQEGIIKVQNMPMPKADHDYQLWVIDPQYPLPVNAGVFHLREDGITKASFKPDQPISSVDKFAVSLERKGGVPQHKGPIVMLGN